jgi:hypothetical protein
MNDAYFTQEVINEVIANYISESGRFIIKLSNSCEAEIKKFLLNKVNDSAALNMSSKNNMSQSDNSDIKNITTEEFELSTLKDNDTLGREDWAKISEILSTFENCNEPYLMTCMQELKQNEENFTRLSSANEKKKKKEKESITNPNPCNPDDIQEIYEMVIKAILNQAEKGNDRVVLSFSPKENLDKYYENHYKKKAYVLVTPHEDLNELLETVEYARDKKTKKLKTPSIEVEGKQAKIYNTTTKLISPVNDVDYGYTVLLDDQYCEFFSSLKVLEFFLKTILNKFDPEIECKQIHIRYWDLAKDIMNFFRETMDSKNKIQYFEMDHFEDDPVNVSMGNMSNMS